MRSYLSDRCVLLEEHGTGCFQLDGGRHQNLQGPEAHLKQVITSRRRTHKRLQVDGVQDSCKAAENTKHFWFSEEEVDVEGIYSLYLQMDFSETHSEQSRKLKSSSERHLQLSGRRQVQSALDLHADAVTAVLHADRRRRRRRTQTLTACDSWMFHRRMSSVLPAVTGETGPQL